MPKFDITDWSNFVRGVVSPDSECAMREHLGQSGRARRQVELLQRVAEVAQADQEQQIPEHALRIAKALGSLRRPAEASSGLRRYLPFEITFDSLLEPVAAGTRNLQAQDRQLVFQADPYLLDLRLEHETSSSTVLVGQLLRDAAEPVAEVPFLVYADDQVVGRSQTSDFGELQVEGLPRQSLRLCLLIDSEKCLEVPLESQDQAN